MYKYIIFICGNEAIANDILQSTFLNVVKSFSTFKNKSSIKTWLFTIARNECYQFFRRNKQIQTIYDIENLCTDISLEDTVIRDDELKQILNIINTFDDEIKSLIILRVVNNLSYNEISNILNRTEVWARVNFLRTKKKIIERLGDV